MKDLVEREFPGFDPYPDGAEHYVDLLVRHTLLAQPLAEECTERFSGLSDEDLVALADSFALAACVRRHQLADILASA